MQYKTFEDMPVWQESRKLVNSIYKIIMTNTKLAKDFELSNQLKRAAYSVMLNISEGFERGTNQDCSHFIDFAKGSAGEVRSILYIMLDNGYITKLDFLALQKDIIAISNQLSGFKKYLINRKFVKKF